VIRIGGVGEVRGINSLFYDEFRIKLSVIPAKAGIYTINYIYRFPIKSGMTIKILKRNLCL